MPTRTPIREESDNLICDCCNEALSIDKFDTMDNVCEPCVENNYSTCAGCSNQVHDDDVYYADDDNYCECCFYDYYSYCDSCGEASDRDNIIYVDDYAYCEC